MRPRHTPLLARCATALLLLVVAAACTDDDSAPDPDDLTTTVDADAVVSVTDFSFEPDEVTAGVGDLVEWTNEGEVKHTVTADDDLFDSGELEPEESFAFTFDDPGTYEYRCSLHPDEMRGTVTVETEPDDEP